MGDTTPNMSIYIPSSGEDLYRPSFKGGQENVDTHNHEGAPTGGVQLGEAALKDSAITPNKLSNQVRHEYNYISNLGIAYASPTFSVTSSDGSAMSSSNRAYVTFQSKTNPGQLITLNTATNASFEDATGTSDIAGNLFGYTSGVDVLTDIQFYLYAVMNDAQDTLQFSLSLQDCLDVSPTTSKMGSPASATADDSDSMWFFNDVTFGDYDGNPVRRIACFRMQKTGGAANDWTVQGLTTSDGVGKCSCNADGQPLTKINVDDSSAPGTDPVLPNASGEITVSGAAVAAHSVPVETHSRAANAYNVEVQLGTTVTPTPADSNNVGLLCLNENQFDIDATSGMASLKGSTTTAPVLTLSDDASNAIGPDANGDIGILGGTNIATTAAGNDITVAIDGVIGETNGGTGTGTYTTGDILYSDASNSLTKLPIGSAGEILTVSGGIPAWSGSAGGASGWQFISSATASTSASVEFTSGIDSTYNLYMITVTDLVPQTAGTDFSLRTSTDGGSTWDSGSVDYLGAVILGVTAGSLTQNASGDRLRLTARTTYTLDNSAANAVNGQIFIYSPSNASGRTCFSSVMILPQRSGSSGEAAFCSIYGGGIRDSAADVDAIQLFISSGNITSGTFALYGLSTS